MTGNYFGSMKLGKQLAEKAREVAQEKEEAAARLEELDRLMSLAAILGLSPEAASRARSQAGNQYETREYRECIATCAAAYDALKSDIVSMFTKRMESTTGMMQFLSRRGSDTTSLQEALENVRALLASEKFEDAESSLTSIWQKEEKTLAEIFSHEFSAVQQALMEAKMLCGNIDGVEGALSDARNEVTANNVENAFRLLEHAGGLIARQIRQKVDEELKLLSRKVEISKLFGLGVAPYREKIERIGSQPQDQRLGEMQQMLDSLNMELDRKLRRAFEIRLKTIRSDLSDRTLMTGVVSSASSAVAGIESQLTAGDYDAAYTSLTDLESRLEKAKYDHIARILLNGKKYITMALKSGIDLAPVNEHLNEVRELMKRRRFHEAIAAAEKANDEAMRLSSLTSDADEAMQRLEGEFHALVSLVSNSVEISIRYAEAKRKFESRDLAGFLADSGPLKKDMDALLENFATGQIDALDRSIGALEYLGAETLDMNRRIGAAVSLVKNGEYARSLEMTTALEKDVDVKLLELDQSWMLRAGGAVDSSTGLLKERLEKLMETVRSLDARKESYRAASVAKDVVDWASNGNVFRVRSLIQRTRRLLSVVDEVSSSSAVNMLEAAERNAEMDTESALNTAGEAHDIVYSLLNDYFVREMSSLMDMVSTCRRKRVEIGYGYTLISRSRAALKFEDFEAAARMASLAREEIQNKLKQVEAIEADLVKAEKLLAEARKGNAGTLEMQKLISGVKASLKRYDYSQAKKEISQVLLLEERSMAPSLAAKEIIAVKGVLAVAAEVGIADPDLEARKEQILGLMRERNHYDALITARSLMKDASEAVTSRLTEMVNETAARSAKAEIDGLDVNVVESRLEKARSLISSGQLEQSLSSIRLAGSELELVLNSVSEAITSIEKADAIVIKLDELNMLEAGTFNLLKQAKNLLKNDQHLLALETAKKCLETCSERLKTKGPQLLQEYTEQIYASVGNDGMDGISEEVNGAAAQVASGSLDASDSLITLKSMAERLALQKEMAERTYDVLKKRAAALIQGGISSERLDGDISQVGSLLDARNFKAVIEKGIAVEQLMEDLSKGSERARQKLTALEDKIASYAELGINMDACRAKAAEAAELISSGNFTESTGRMQECESEAERILHQACISKMAAAESASEVASRLGISERDGTTPEYREMIESGDAPGAFAVAARKLEEISPLVASALRDRFENAVNIDGLSQSFTAGMRNEFEELMESQRYSESLDFTEKLERDMKSKSAMLAEMDGLSRQFSDVAGDLRRTGINIRTFDMRYGAITMELSDQSLEEMRKLVDEMKKLKSEYSPRLTIGCSGSRWGPQLTVTNAGRVVALSASVSIKGEALTKVEALGNLKPGESRTMNLPGTVRGEIVVSAVASSPVDNGNFSTTLTFHLDGSSITPLVFCPACRGKIRSGGRSYTCACGRTYHEQCARRSSACECGKPISM